MLTKTKLKNNNYMINMKSKQRYLWAKCKNQKKNKKIQRNKLNN